MPPTVLAPPDAPLRPQSVTAPKRPGLPYLGGVDGLRALSVAAVLAYHGGLVAAPGGFLGVEVFFVISGYLITALLVTEQRRAGTVSLRHFWLRRAKRLLPALFSLLAATSIAAMIGAPDVLVRLRRDVPAAVLYVTNWSQIFHSDSYFAQIGRPPLLDHLWSLAVEEQFYLVIPVLALLLLPRVRRGALAVCAIAGAGASAVALALLFQPDHDNSSIYLATHTRLSGLLLGVVLGLIWSPWRLRAAAAHAAPGARWVLDASAVVGLVVLGWAIHTANGSDPFIYRGGFVVVDVATLAVIAAVVHPSSHAGRLLGVGPLRWLGQRSYGIYLWHFPIFQMTRPDIDLRWSEWAVWALRIALTLIVATLSYRFIEQPVRTGALSRRWADRPEVRHHDIQAVLGGALVVGLIVAVGPVIRPDRATQQLEERAAREAADNRKPFLENLTGTTAPRGTTTTSTTTQPTTTLVPTTAVDPAATVPPGGDPTATAVAPTDVATPIAPTTVPAPTTTLSPAQIRVTAIGDSVMLDAKKGLQRTIPQIAVDARVSRQFSEVNAATVRLAAFGALGPIVIIHLGTNGAVSEQQLDHIIDGLADRKVILVTAHVPRPWEVLNNIRIREAAQRHSNVTIADWNAISGPHPDWFVHDGTHLQGGGIVAYTEMLRVAVQ